MKASQYGHSVSMAENPGDINLQKSGSDELDLARRPPRRPAALIWIVAGVLVLALAGAYMYLRRAPTQPAAPQQTQKPVVATPSKQAEPGQQIPLPPLDETDPLVRELVGRLSSHPATAAWLTTDGLIQNFVLVTARIANAEIPGSELKKAGPIGRFRTKTSGGMLYVDADSYRRYDRYAEPVAAPDARGSARLYATLKPRIADAYRRLGQTAGDFDAVLERAIVQLLSVPVLDGDVALEPRGIGYAFADPRLEGMSPGQKQLLRMGPRNVRLIQGKLREIADYLAIPAAKLPQRQ